MQSSSRSRLRTDGTAGDGPNTISGYPKPSVTSPEMRNMCKTILVVDDDVHVLVLIELFLKRYGFHVVKTNVPQKALDIIRMSPPDLIISDVMMPGMSGIELCALLRNMPQTRYIPIIVVSANADVEVSRNCMAVGANLFLTKLDIHQRLVREVFQLLNLAGSG
jgi:CheY-like chemotaxis protein